MIRKQRPQPFFKRHRSTVIVLAVLVLISCAGAYAWHHHSEVDNKQHTGMATHNPRPIGDVDYGPPSPHDNDAINQRKDSPSTSGDTLDSTPLPTDSSITVTITRVNADTTAKVLTVGTMVEGATAGSCELRLTHDGATTVTKSAIVHQDVNAYTCGVFSVPFSDIPVSGEWRASVVVTVNGKAAAGTWPDAVNISK